MYIAVVTDILAFPRRPIPRRKTVQERNMKEKSSKHMRKLLPLKFHKVHIIVGSWYLIHEKDLRRKCCIHDGYIHRPSPSLFDHKQQQTTTRGVASLSTCRPGITNFWFDHSTSCKKLCVVGLS